MMEHDPMRSFLMESLAIEGIYREPTDAEVAATEEFLAQTEMSLDAICSVQAVYAPGMPLRNQSGMDVRVGRHLPPPGSMMVVRQLETIAHDANGGSDPWHLHVWFETLHPFMDGNGRTGRILWAWCMKRVGQDPFALSFLHRWYYQTLERSDRR